MTSLQCAEFAPDGPMDPEEVMRRVAVEYLKRLHQAGESAKEKDREVQVALIAYLQSLEKSAPLDPEAVSRRLAREQHALTNSQKYARVYAPGDEVLVERLRHAAQ